MLKKKNIWLRSILAAALLLGGCSGNSGCDDASYTSGYVVKGLIQNAKICVDENINYQCDTDEEFTYSSAQGYYSFDRLISYPLVVVLDLNSFDTSLQKSYNLVLYAPQTTLDQAASRDVTVFTSLNTIAVKDRNISVDAANKRVAQKFGVDENSTQSNYINNPALTKTQRDELESAAGYALQLLVRSYEIFNQAVDANLTLQKNSKEATEALVDVIFKDDNATVYTNLDINATLVREIVDSIISSLDDNITTTSSGTSADNKEKAIIQNKDSKTTLEKYAAAVVPDDTKLAYEGLYLVPFINDRYEYSDSLSQFSIVDFDENITGNSRSLTLSFSLEGSSYDSVVVPFVESAYGKLLDENLAIAVAMNTNLGDSRLNSGNYLTISHGDTNSIEYWGLSTKESICDANDSAILDAVERLNTNAISCEE